MSIDSYLSSKAFQQHFNNPVEIAARAPGRVNIIGEHTDYNDGFVLPMAIEHDTVIVGRSRRDAVLRLRAENLDLNAEITLDELVRQPENPWADYIAGVAQELKNLGLPVAGADMLIMGDVPIGCGLSSSAALEMAALVFFEQAGGFKLDDAEAAQLGQRVENDFLGLSTGIMDQFISRCGRAGHALFLDCRNYAYDLVPVKFNDARFVIANTACPRGLTASKYNERVAECALAVEAMKAILGKQDNKLRDYTMQHLFDCQDYLDDIPFRRARHVISENDRTLAAVKAMREGDTAVLGTLMDSSDASLRTDYEVTSRELDILARLARTHPGCFGARMTGAGFGGCTLNLVRSAEIEGFCSYLMAEYTAETGLEGEAYISAPASGAGTLPM